MPDLRIFDFDIVHPGMVRPFVAPVHKFHYLRFKPLCFNKNRTIRLIAHSAFDPEFNGFFPGRYPEPYSLDPA